MSGTNTNHCDFSLNHYFDTLEKATQELDYVTAPVSKAFAMRSEGISTFILLRHDIDFSLDYALTLAKEEAKRGYLATYYVLLHSPTYNALSPEGMTKIQEIAKLGHEIALHLDTKYQIPDEHLILQDIAGNGQKIETWSAHVPSLRDKGTIQDLMDCSVLRNYEIKYISDSGRNWREGCLCQWIGKAEAERIQCLIHPLWWITETKTREEAIHELGMDLINDVHKQITQVQMVLEDYKIEVGIK